MKGFLLLLALLILLFGSPASAGVIDGWIAYGEGDYKTAVKEFRRLAENGDDSAQKSLGDMYDKGTGVIQDYKTAIKWYKLSAVQGNTIAMRRVGGMYYKGRGVTQDYKTAAKWYKLAAEQGNFFAQAVLGDMYLEGKGVTKNYILAHMWWNMAASLGFSIAPTQRSEIEKKMTPAQIEKAQELARECVARNYKDC